MNKHVIVYTDGSYIKKYDLCGYGVYFPNNEYKNISRPFTKTPKTNQRAELYAIYVALILIKKHVQHEKITIYTDSQYSIKSLTEWLPKWKQNGWRTYNNGQVKNLDIIQPIDSILTKMVNKVQFIHVKSHAKHKTEIEKNNDIADKLAKSGAYKGKKGKDKILSSNKYLSTE
jgi:ribonuclease HI